MNKLTTVLGLCILVLLAVSFFWLKEENIAEIAKPVILKDELPILRSNPIIVAAGDIACSSLQESANECQQAKTAELVKKINPDMVLALGDLQYPFGTLQNFLNYYDKSWGQFKDKTYPTLGNHEYLPIVGAAGYFSYFNGDKNKSYYSFDLGSWHLVALNSNCFAVGGCGISSPQNVWLKKDLANNKARCTLAFFHHPLFSSGNYYPGLEFVKDFWKVLYNANVDLVLNGHDHIYERFAKVNTEGQKDNKGIRQFTVGTGGRNLYGIKSILPTSEIRQNKEFGVLKLTLNADNYEWEFVSTKENGFKDSGKENCH